MKKESHEFSFYLNGLKDFSVGEVVVSDKDFVHRLAVVLRFSKNSKIRLFDGYKNAVVEVININKKDSVTIKVVDIKDNKKYEPHIVLLLPVLKKVALEEAVYNAVEVGTNEIQLLYTEKVQRKFGGEKELGRLVKIAIAAAEQSKSFSVPKIALPIKLEDFLKKDLVGEKIFFDVKGAPLLSVLKNCTQQKLKKLYVLIGPEGDLNNEEKQLLSKQDFSIARLTPTILRAQQATSVSIGLVRAILNN